MPRHITHRNIMSAAHAEIKHNITTLKETLEVIHRTKPTDKRHMICLDVSTIIAKLDTVIDSCDEITTAMNHFEKELNKY